MPRLIRLAVLFAVLALANCATNMAPAQTAPPTSGNDGGGGGMGGGGSSM